LFQNKRVLLVSLTIISVLLSTTTAHCGSAVLSVASSIHGEDASPRILGSTSHVLVSRSVSFLVVDGVVENALNVNARVNVTANFFDANNNSVGVLCRATDLNLMRPGQRSPFTFYWPINSTDITYELSLSYEQTSEQPVDILEFRDVVNETENSQLIIAGKVWNGRPLKALSVSVACICYDGEGDFSGLARTFVPSVDADGLAEFNVTLDSSVEVGSHDLVVYAAGYENRSIVNYVLFTILVLLFLCFIIFMKRRGW
jgi:hypothetical protein